MVAGVDAEVGGQALHRAVAIVDLRRGTRVIASRGASRYSGGWLVIESSASGYVTVSQSTNAAMAPAVAW